MGKAFPTWLKQGKPPFVVEYHDDRKHGFHQETPDDEWLEVVGKKKWVVVTHDKRFHKDGMATLAVYQHKVACFYMDGAQLQPLGKMTLFLRAYPRLKSIVASQAPPFIYHVTHTGRVVAVKGGWAKPVSGGPS